MICKNFYFQIMSFVIFMCSKNIYAPILKSPTPSLTQTIIMIFYWVF